MRQVTWLLVRCKAGSPCSVLLLLLLLLLGLLQRGAVLAWQRRSAVLGRRLWVRRRWRIAVRSWLSGVGRLRAIACSP